MPQSEPRQPADEPEFARAARAADLADGAGRIVDVAGRWIALFRVGDDFFAVDNACPHMAGPLGSGSLDGYVVTCPLHYWKIDVRTGCSPTNEFVRVSHYEVRVRDGWVEIGPEVARA